MRAPPVMQKPKYDKAIWGYGGQFSPPRDKGIEVRFVQSIVTATELEEIKLIRDIPDSAKWSVRDLFQREVDKERVEKGLMPYLAGTDERGIERVRYFNPLTLVVLPMDGNEVSKELNAIKRRDIEEDDYKFTTVYEQEGYYQFSSREEADDTVRLDYSHRNCRIVAVDGQHRLSALKRLAKREEIAGSQSNIDSWKIPVIYLIFSSSTGSDNLPGVLRKLFIDINNRSKEIHESRLILLDDENISRVSTQEVVEAAHENDCLPTQTPSLTQEVVEAAHENDKRDRQTRRDEIVPLLFFDWRGIVTQGKDQPMPAHICSVTELQLWIQEYLFADDYSILRSNEQLTDNDGDIIKSIGNLHSESHIKNKEEADNVRSRFRLLVRSGLMYLFRYYRPFKGYIDDLRKIEGDRNKNDNMLHAFERLRFGSDNAEESQKEEVDACYRELIKKIEEYKQKHIRQIASLIDRDIGKRAIIYAYFETWRQWNSAEDLPYSSSLEHAERFVPAIDSLTDKGWFQNYDALRGDLKKMLRNIAHDGAGAIINYRIGEVKKGFGALIALLALDIIKQNEAERKDKIQGLIEGFIENVLEDDVHGTAFKGWNRFHRQELADAQLTVEQRKAEAKKRAKESTDKQIDEIKKYLSG